MGNSLTKQRSSYYANEEEKEEDSIEEDFIPATRQQMQERMDRYMTTDAAINTSNTSSNLQRPNQNVSDNVLTLEKVEEIEKELDLNEKISLIYLLYDSPDLALQYALQLQYNAPLQILTEWATKSNERWNVKLLEALCIIQNYYVLCEILGFDKDVLKSRFLPQNENSSLLIDRLKKKLYRIAESFDISTTKRFLEIVQNDFKTRKLDFQQYNLQYLEMYFLYWTTIRYISPPHDLSNICKAFKVLEMYDIVESLKDFTTERPASTSYRFNYNLEEIPPLRLTSESPNLRVDLIRENSVASSSAADSDFLSPSNRVRKISHDEEDCYDINPENPGICLIINQENFYTEFQPEWKHLIPKTEDKLENRDGTNIDRDRLKETFERFGFKVIVKDNVVHYNIIPMIQKVISQEVTKSSSFIVCILSHGLEGTIFGVNSIPVDVREIQSVMQNAKLKGRPKVLILQACQGHECQKVAGETMDKENKEQEDVNNEFDDCNSDLLTDGPVTTVPQTADMLVFWATVPGFGAIRDRKRGSWFIQSLCDKIVEKADVMHLQEICTKVKQDVINRRWQKKKSICVMVPIEESTFSKFFYLPKVKTADN